MSKKVSVPKTTFTAATLSSSSPPIVSSSTSPLPDNSSRLNKPSCDPILGNIVNNRPILVRNLCWIGTHKTKFITSMAINNPHVTTTNNKYLLLTLPTLTKPLIINVGWNQNNKFFRFLLKM